MAVSFLFWRVAAFAWAILLLASVSVAQRSNQDAIRPSRGGSLRGLTAAVHYPGDIATDDDDENENDEQGNWWSDFMSTEGDPLEEREIHRDTPSQGSPQTPMLHTTDGAPYLGPVINITKLDASQLQELVKPQPTSRIVNGQASKPQSFFTMLLIQNNNDWRWSGCGGTLISACHVLTAGHCLANPTMQVEGVFVNAHSPFHDNNNNFPFHFSLVKKRDVHPQFVQQTNQADVGILTLQDCVDVKDFPPAILAQDRAEFRNNGNMQSSASPKLSMEVLGFGSMSDAANVPADSLRSVVLPFISRDQCRKYYPQGEVLDDMVCAGYANTGGPDACQGDSGGGMFLHGDGSKSTSAPTLVGITSWGVGCGRKNYPGVYIYIPYYRGWITGKICSSNNNQGSNCPQRAPQPQQQQQSGNNPSNNNNNNSANTHNSGTCRKEGESCDIGGDSQCCSNFCRGFPGAKYRVCTGMLPSRQEQTQPEKSQGVTDPNKLGGAGGAKEREQTP